MALTVALALTAFAIDARLMFLRSCDQQAMTKHVMEMHPDVAKDMEKIHNHDPEKWGNEMKPKWDATIGD